MSKSEGLLKLSAEYIRAYPFQCGGSEFSDYLIKREVDERTKDCYYVACYAFVRANYFFLFSHDSARSCKQAVNLQRCVVRPFQPDKHWPSCCGGAGFQVWPPGSGYTEAAAASTCLPDTCWQLGIFPASAKLRRWLEGHTRRGSSEAAAAAAAAAGPEDSEYNNNETDDGDSDDPELSGLWASLDSLEPCQLTPAARSQQPANLASLDDSSGSGSGCGSVAAMTSRLNQAAAAGPVISSSPPAPPLKSPKPPSKLSPQPPVRNTPVGGTGGLTSVQPKTMPPSPSPTNNAPRPPPVPSLLDAAPVTSTLPLPLAPQTNVSTPTKFTPQPLKASTKGQMPRRDVQPMPPVRDPQPPVPTRDPQPPVPTRDPQPPVPTRDPQPPVPTRDPQPPVPTRDPQPPVPTRDPQPPVRTRDPQPPVPTRDPQPPVPTRDPQPPVPTRDPQPPVSSLELKTSLPQATTASTDLYEMLLSAGSVDALCGYYCYGYYGQENMSQARQLMKRATDDGVYMLRGFCNRQAGQEKTLCIKYGMVYKLRVLVSNGYQIGNEHNEIVHKSMEALLLYHHIHPIKVGQPIEHDLMLRRPYDFEPKVCASDTHLTFPLAAALWNHGSKELCAEVLKNSDDGTYALRADQESGFLVLCVTHRCQILKFRINVTKTGQTREFAFHHNPSMLKFTSIEEFIVYHHKHQIRGSASTDGEIYLRMPFQLVQRCQQELDFQQLALESLFTNDSVENAKMKVAKMKIGNFLLRRGAAVSPADGEDGGGGCVAAHALIVREDSGGYAVRVFRILERDTDLSFRPQKIFTLEDRPELVTDRIEKMVHFLSVTTRFLSPDITSLVKP